MTVESVLGHFGKRCRLHDAGICEHDVEVALLSRDLAKKAIQLIESANISADCGDVTTDAFHRCIERIATPSRDEDVSAAGNELLRCRKTDPAAAAGDESNLAFEPIHECPLFRCQIAHFDCARLGHHVV